MRGNPDFQAAMFSYISLEERVPAAHPLRKLRAVVDALLATMSSEFEAVYARRGRPSVPPEMLLKALLLQIPRVRHQIPIFCEFRESVR